MTELVGVKIPRQSNSGGGGSATADVHAFLTALGIWICSVYGNVYQNGRRVTPESGWSFEGDGWPEGVNLTFWDFAGGVAAIVATLTIAGAVGYVIVGAGGAIVAKGGAAIRAGQDFLNWLSQQWMQRFAR